MNKFIVKKKDIFVDNESLYFETVDGIFILSFSKVLLINNIPCRYIKADFYYIFFVNTVN